MSLNSDIQILRAQTPEDIDFVKIIFLEYLNFVEDYLGQSLGFQNTEKEFSDFPQTYDGLFLAKVNGKAMAACGIKPFKPNICELKRLYCRQDGRGHGLGLKVTHEAMCFAKGFGYKDIYLDTDHGLIHANSIYEKLGFQDIEKYYDNPMDSRFMGRSLLDYS